MRKVHVHTLAEDDLVGIWRYTLEEWSEAQAEAISTSWTKE